MARHRLADACPLSALHELRCADASNVWSILTLAWPLALGCTIHASGLKTSGEPRCTIVRVGETRRCRPSTASETESASGPGSGSGPKLGVDCERVARVRLVGVWVC